MAAPTQLEPFVVSPDDPLADDHALVLAWVEDPAAKVRLYTKLNLADLPSGQRLLEANPPRAKGCVLAAVEQAKHWQKLAADVTAHSRRIRAEVVIYTLLKRILPFDGDDLLVLLQYCGDELPADLRDIRPLARNVERFASKSSLSEEHRALIHRLAKRLQSRQYPAAKKVVAGLLRLVSDGSLQAGEAWTDAVNADLAKTADLHSGRDVLHAGEAWSDAAKADLGSTADSQKCNWLALMAHAHTATASRPPDRWLRVGRGLIEQLGDDQVRESLVRWLPLVSQGRTIPNAPRFDGDVRGAADTMSEENATCLRGLLWLAPLLPRREELIRPIAAVALSAYKKVPGVGPRAVKVGNAAIYALSQMASTDAVGQLAMLKTRVKFGTAQKEIEKAFNAAAAALNLPRDEIEELGVPSYGLEEVGRTAETFGNYRAELVVNGSDAAIKWFDAHGKPLKAVPAKVKQEHKDDLNELQQSLKDIQAMLPAQRDRIDSMFLAQKSWPFANWQERYLDHPLVGTIAGRLIWCVDGTPAVLSDGKATDVRGETVKHGETAEITLWHPVGREVKEVVAWRERLEQLGITQPFKQAHREVYLLTDAERRTNTYSNRFAAHVLRQHQFNALCAARG